MWTGPGSCAHGKLPMYKLNARDHFNCSRLLFWRLASQNRCGQMEGGGTYWPALSYWWHQTMLQFVCDSLLEYTTPWHNTHITCGQTLCLYLFLYVHVSHMLLGLAWQYLSAIIRHSIRRGFSASVCLFVCLFAWGLTALSAQIGYIAP